TMAVLWRRASDAEAAAIQQGEAARQQAQRATQIQSLLEGALTSIQPERAHGRDVSLLREVLEEVERRIDTELKDQPEVEISLRNTIAETYERIGMHAESERHAQQSLALQRRRVSGRHPQLARTLAMLSVAQRGQARMKEARA